MTSEVDGIHKGGKKSKLPKYGKHHRSGYAQFRQ